MTRVMGRRLMLSTVLAVVMAFGSATTSQAMAVPTPNSCATGAFAEMHGGYPYFYRFATSRTTSSNRTVSVYHYYWVGVYHVRGPIIVGSAVKLCYRYQV